MDRLALRRLSLAEIPASASRSRDREAERTAAALNDAVDRKSGGEGNSVET